MSSDGDEDFQPIVPGSKDTEDYIRGKIVHVLTMYPRISRSMLQVGLSTGLPPKLWSPIFEQMVTQGICQVETYSTDTMSGRNMAYHVISLVPKNA